jgi:hypothetical protein
MINLPNSTFICGIIRLINKDLSVTTIEKIKLTWLIKYSIDQVIALDSEFDETIENDNEEYQTETSIVQTRLRAWVEMPLIPNKKRFIILSILFSVIELIGILVITYAFINQYELGLFDFSIFIMAPFTGLALSYFVENHKEATGISAINASSSILISLVIYILVKYYRAFPVELTLNPITHFGIPLGFIIVQIAVAFTIARVRNLYRRYGDSTQPRKSDEAMIAELKRSRISRGLEEPEEATEDNSK